jgi:hypothetical protein
VLVRGNGVAQPGRDADQRKFVGDDRRRYRTVDFRHSQGRSRHPLTMTANGMVRAPAPPATNLARGSKDKEHAMSNLNSAVAVIGIDIGKNSFHLWSEAWPFARAYGSYALSCRGS